MGSASLAGSAEEAKEEVQHLGTEGEFEHLQAAIKKARLAGVVGRQWLGDNERWGYRVNAGMLCVRDAC